MSAISRRRNVQVSTAPEVPTMPQSLAKLYVHLIFSTKQREPVLARELGPDLHAYVGGILKEHDSIPIEINSQPDHAHVLFLLGRTAALSNTVGQLKQGSTLWLRQQHPALRDFHWQNGYGAFSVSQSNVDEVRRYIQDQQEHHRQRTFQDEFRAFLTRHGVAYDERYVWD
jgi:putative transposase